MIRKMVVGGIGIAATAAVLAACSTAEPTPVLTAPVSTNELAEAGLLKKVDTTPDVSSNEKFGVVPSEETGSDRYGTFTRITLADDAPILTYDPAGPWADVGAQFGADYVSATLSSGARFFVEDWIDSPAQWDDSAPQWRELESALEASWGEQIDLHATLVEGLKAPILFDVGDWREDLGLKPVPYKSGVPRIRVNALRVLDMSIDVPNETPDAPRLKIAYWMSYSQPVVTEDGTFELDQQMWLNLFSRPSTGGGSGFYVSGDYSIGRETVGGTKALPVFAVPASAPEGWQEQELGRLAYAIPPGAQLSPPDDDDLVEYTLDAPTAAGGEPAALTLRENTRSAPEGEPGWWSAVKDFENYGLRIPGATSAAAETGVDSSGRFRARVFITVVDGEDMTSYRIEWDTTPKTAEKEIAQYVGAMSITAP